MNRILDISESPAYLSLDNNHLVIESDSQGKVRVHLSDLSALIVSHPQVTFTHALLSRLALENIVFITCDKSHLPAGMVLPLQTHHAQTQIFAQQAALPLPTKNRIWKSIVKAKVTAQAQALKRCRGSDFGLLELVSHVRTGDSTNIESQAARRYWPALFGEDFTRSFDVVDQNQHLNYSYAILRGIITRAICAAGMHPSLGLHHHHRGNPFALSDDLIEPFRPLADEIVFEYARNNSVSGMLNPTAKKYLLTGLTSHYRARKRRHTLFNIAAAVAESLAKVCSGRTKDIYIPTDLTRLNC